MTDTLFLSPAPAPPVTVPVLLEHARAAYTPALREAIGTLTPPLDVIAGYHLGWNDLCGNATSDHGGKAVRPALTLLGTLAAGADAHLGVPGAVAVDLIHNFSLLHDDFMDGDELRRDRPTAWTVFGAAQAVLTGDALLALATRVIVQAPSCGATSRDTARALERLASANYQLVNGQARDLAYEQRDVISLQECLQMEDGKTGALLACACSIGAVLAGADDATADALDRFGHHLGLAFQAVDDLLGIWGDPAVTGKPRWNDLIRRKKSLPVCAALNDAGAASRQLAHRLAGGHGDADGEQRLASLAALIETAGGRAWAESEARRQHRSALAALDEIAAPEPVRRHFTALADFVVQRTR
ncbi:polyprenyl synthetase family protein [Kitasatospora sp. NPDC048540]|uniref:polyprenyl synthetase family protein n=1 Tax=unclassified Kitasatospora TaxID=2633591 RepID=UPI00053A3549|nr:polyprenyl synthetase family protein [Kitasatospora sp. MBT63]